MTARGVEDSRPPFITMTPVGTPVAEERFVAMVQSYAQEPLAQTFSSAFSQTIHGKPIKSGTPMEVEAETVEAPPAWRATAETDMSGADGIPGTKGLKGE